MSTLGNLFSKVAPWFYLTAVFAVSMNSIKCPIPHDRSYMKSWNNKQSQLQKLESSPLSTLEPVFLHLRIQSEVNTIPISQFRKTLIFLRPCFLDSILST